MSGHIESKASGCWMFLFIATAVLTGGYAVMSYACSYRSPAFYFEADLIDESGTAVTGATIRFVANTNAPGLRWLGSEQSLSSKTDAKGHCWIDAGCSKFTLVGVFGADGRAYTVSNYDLLPGGSKPSGSHPLRWYPEGDKNYIKLRLVVKPD